jgi:malonate transporter
MTLILLNALLPIFVGLLLGYIAGRRGVMDNLNVRNLIVLVMDFAIPCALFSTISSVGPYVGFGECLFRLTFTILC